MDTNKDILTRFYKQCLTVGPDANVAEALGEILADDFVSHGSADTKTKEELIGMVGFFWKLIPDLKWEPQEIIHEGNKYVVRSVASGTPSGDFMGTPTDGTKSFKIMTIDIHTVEDGQIRSVHHLEDWGTAMQQLKG